jgi:hypothetical protein
VRRGWLLVAVGLGIAAIAVAVLVARLGEDDEGSVATSEWAESVCASLSGWQSSITGLAEVEGELTQESLEERLDDAGAATDELLAELQAIGPPDLDAGDEVEQALDDSAEGLRESYESLRTAAEDALDAETPSAFLQELASLAPEFQALVRQVQDTVAALQSASLFGEVSAELEQAFAEAPSCERLREAG